MGDAVYGSGDPSKLSKYVTMSDPSTDKMDND